MGLMECYSPPSGDGTKRRGSFREGSGEVRKGLMGCLCALCSEMNQTAPVMRASQTEGETKLGEAGRLRRTRCLERNSAKGVPPEADSGEFPDDL